MKSKIGFLLIIAMISSCSNNKSSYGRKLAFNTFMCKFKPLDLPITIRLDDSNILECSTTIDSKSTDTLFVKSNGNFVSYGRLRDTTNYYALIYVVIGDDPYFGLLLLIKDLIR